MAEASTDELVPTGPGRRTPELARRVAALLSSDDDDAFGEASELLASSGHDRGVGLLAMVLRRSRDDPKVTERAVLMLRSLGDYAPARKAAAEALRTLAHREAVRTNGE